MFLVCWLAICGIPVFSGFFSKDAIIAGAFATTVYNSAGLAWVGPFVGVLLVLAALGTAFYMSRLYFLVFSGPSPAPTPRPSTTSTNRRASWSARWCCWRSARFWAAFIGIPGALFDHPELNLIGHFFEPVLGAGDA